MSQAWRPWRSYAVLHIWKHPVQAAKGARPVSLRAESATP